MKFLKKCIFTIGLLAAWLNVFGADFPTFPDIVSSQVALPLPIKDALEFPSDTPKHHVLEGSYVFPTRISDNLEIKLAYRVPSDLKGNPLPSASNIVYFAIPPVWGKNSKDRDYLKEDYIRKLSDVYGYTVFTIGFNMDKTSIDNVEEAYYYNESGSFDIVFSVQDWMTKQFGLQPRKLLLLGSSGGGIMASQMAMHREDRVEAVAFTGARNFPRPNKKSNVHWCIVNTRGDVRNSENMQFVKKLRELGTNVLYAETPPNIPPYAKAVYQGDHHSSVTKHTYNILLEFLHSVVELRNADGDILPASEWPYAAPNSDSFNIGTPPELDGAKPATKYPSREFAQLWMTIPYRRFVLPDGTVCNLRHPYLESGAARGIVIYCDFKSSDMEADDILDFFASHGYIAISAGKQHSEMAAYRGNRSLAKWLTKENAFSKYPMFIVGIGSGGRHALLAASSGARCDTVIVANPEVKWPFPQLSPTSATLFLNSSVKLIFGSNDTELLNNMNDYLAECGKLQKQASLVLMRNKSNLRYSKQEYLNAILEQLILEIVKRR